jgi:hypothetical protein
MAKLSEIQLTLPPPKILLWGEAGCGKTALAATFGDGMQFIALENRLPVCYNLNDNWKSNRMSVDLFDAIEPDPIGGAITFPRVKQRLLEMVNQGSAKKLTFADGKPVKAVGVDTLTTLVEAAKRYVLYNVGKLGKGMIKSNEPKDALKNNLSQGEWGLIITEVEQCLQLIRSLSVPVILLAHKQNVLTETGSTRYEIDVPTKSLPTTVPRMFDEIWYMETAFAAGGVIQYRIRTKNSPLFVARSNANLPDNLDTSIGMKGILDKMGYKVPQ